jgi:hypothetical protein
MSGFFCQDKYLQKLANLTDEEMGILIRALIRYHADGELPDLTGGVSIAFDFIRDDIDQQEEAYRKKCEQASENRRKGIGQKKTDDNARQRPSTNDNGRDKYNNNLTITEHNKNQTESSFIEDESAATIQHEHDRVFTAAEDAGFKMSNIVRARLIALYADNGLEKMLAGFNECATHGAPTLAYLEAVLKGTGKKKPQMKVLPAQDFPQRDYSSVDNDMIGDLEKEIAAMKAGEAG